jgi:hypothetical protein
MIVRPYSVRLHPELHPNAQLKETLLPHDF